MIFQFMEKYRGPIIVIGIVSMFGFGAIVYLSDAIFGSSRRKGEKDPKEVIASFEVGGEKVEVQNIDYWQTLRDLGIRENTDDPEAAPAYALASMVRNALVDRAGIVVSDAELAGVIDKQIKEQLAAGAEGAADKKAYTNWCNSLYRATPAQFEAMLREDLRLAKLMREIERISGHVSSNEIAEQYRKLFAKVKIKAVVFDSDAFKEQAKLARLADDSLDPAAEVVLGEYWTGLTEAEKKRYHKGGALLTVELLGFRFSKYATDEELAAEFNRENPISKTSLAKLTEGFVPNDEVLAKLEGRLGRHRDVYKVAADADIKAEFETRKARLIQEWQIQELIFKLHGEILAKIKDGAEVDFQALADANNLQTNKLTQIPLEKLRDHEEWPGFYAYSLQQVDKGKILEMRAIVTKDTDAFHEGIVDDVGRHVDIWRMIDKDLSPIPSYPDVKVDLAKDYEVKQAEKLRDEAIAAFQKSMDTFMDEKVKDFAATAKSEAATAIAEETKGLDPTNDKDKIESITKQKNEEADQRIAEEKRKYRGEAFDVAVATPPAGGVIVEEGYFLPQLAKSELVLKKDEASTEELARSFARREMTALHDEVQSDRFVEVGTVTDLVGSTVYRTLKGIAKLVDKKQPTLEEMFLHPDRMTMAEAYLRRKKASDEKDTVWSFANLKKGDFKVATDGIDKSIAEERETRRKSDEETRKMREDQKRRAEERRNGKEGAAAPSNPDEVPPSDPAK